MSEQILLRMVNIHKRFPGVYALKNINFDLRAGEVHALLGENGAGKSTLIKVLGGIYHPDEGKIYIDGKKAEITNVLDAQKLGVAIIHQELVLAPYMTVAENIFLGREPKQKGFLDKKRMFEETKQLLETYSMNFSPNTQVSRLTIAQQQMVEIIKAISYNSKILVMDEPTSSISEAEVTFLFSMMRTLTQKGVGIIYISHKMSELSQICDRVTVLRDGEYVGTKVVKETTRDELITMMVGRKLENYYIRDYSKGGEKILECQHLNDGKMVKDVSFFLRKGEILGLAGLVGAGRSETMQCVFGLTKGYKGKVFLEGKEMTFHSPTTAFSNGIALVPEDRKLDGLYMQQSVQFNATIEVLHEFLKGIKKNNRKEKEIAQTYIDMMHTKTPSLHQTIMNLSGGNQQKVLIGRWLATKPKVLILDEPTRGVDVGAKAEIYAIMNELAKEGLSIIMISSEMPEIINMSDRVYVFADGIVRGCINHEELTQEKIMALAAV
ncbi:MAG: sugar ABC transporter ATP-binding protein [Sphaerochaeta sp.]|jgi:ribose transport system ATP-binding protein|nr:sugar ABC transporter ATP-binding protein [Sphaerochaeta sp.]